MSNFDTKTDKPSEFTPGTMVYPLVEQLREYLK
jgi:hypothetical protein